MARKWKILLVSAVFIVGVTFCSGCLLLNWVMINDRYELISTVVDEDILLDVPEDEWVAPEAFAMALLKNHPSAYEMIDPALAPRLDKWMNTHQVPECVGNLRAATGYGIMGPVVMYYCETTADREYSLMVEVELEEMKVTNWFVHKDGY